MSATILPSPKKARKNPQRRQSEQAKRNDPGVQEIQTKPETRPSRPLPPTRAQTMPTTNPLKDKIIIQVNDTLPTNVASKARSNSNAILASPRNTRDLPSAQSSSRAASTALAPAAIITGGLLGCVASAALLAGVGIWQDSANNDSAILAARTAKLCLNNFSDELIASLKAGTYSTDEALDMLRRTSLAYASTVPGGVAYIERIFRELALIRQTRASEVATVMRQAQAALHEAAKKGASPDDMRLGLVRQLSTLSSFAGTAIRDVVDRNPELKPYKDGAVKALEGSPAPKVPTVKLNIKVKQKPAS
ncbi:hypothetical protein LTR78_010558 [Recurvomyces mirabilis]|uniref:Uncharacterized protein n=1 Tax=Recurvomyces mirabilis TaxID=574656 RepID=A0AAE0TQ86_9PEZI|nr:hypothetical protein LTR78_010558 [Recurvomyces mirabilis]